MHGVREELLVQQAKMLELSLYQMFIPQNCNMPTYDALLKREMQKLKALGMTHCAFGDIFLEDLKAYRESQMKACETVTLFPIWKEADTTTLARRIIDSGIKAIVVCVSGKYFDASFAGREYNMDFLNDLPKGVDPCGENGEFHTFVYDSPQFKKTIPVRLGETVDKVYTPAKDESDTPSCGAEPSWDTSFYFKDLLLAP